MTIALNNLPLFCPRHDGYFAGTKDGIVTIAGQPAIRRILVFDSLTMKLVSKVYSYKNGNYLVPFLRSDRKYTLIATDNKHEYTPPGYHWRLPSTTRTIAEQQGLIKEWQSA